MRNEDFKIINERWDKYVKEDSRVLNEGFFQELNYLIQSGQLETAATYIGFVYTILNGLGWFAVKTTGGYIALRTVYRYISKSLNQQDIFQEIHSEFEKLLSENPNKKQNIQVAHTLVYDSFKQVSDSTLRLVDAKVIKRELEQETGERSEGVLEKLSEFVLAKFKLAGDKLAGGINVFIAGNYADPELRKNLFALILSDTSNVGKYLKTKSSYDPKTGALNFEPAAPPPPTKDPEGREETPSGLALPSGDDVKKFG
jgi:hypothetical protein